VLQATASLQHIGWFQHRSIRLDAYPWNVVASTWFFGLSAMGIVLAFVPFQGNVVSLVYSFHRRVPFRATRRRVLPDVVVWEKGNTVFLLFLLGWRCASSSGIFRTVSAAWKGVTDRP
jgi:hypothetical protein